MFNSVLWAQIEEKFREVFVPGDFLGMLVFCVIVAIEVSFLNAHPREIKRDRKMELAIELGHVVGAHKVKEVYKRRGKVSKLSGAVYEYKAGGKCYEYKFLGYGIAPEYLDLYYVRDARKAFPYMPREKMWVDFLALLFPLVVMEFIIAYFRGML